MSSWGGGGRSEKRRLKFKYQQAGSHQKLCLVNKKNIKCPNLSTIPVFSKASPSISPSEQCITPQPTASQNSHLGSKKKKPDKRCLHFKVISLISQAAHLPSDFNSPHYLHRQTFAPQQVTIFSVNSHLNTNTEKLHQWYTHRNLHPTTIKQFRDHFS